MTANEFGRETHWIIVRSDAEKQWHARCVSNFRIIVSSPQYHRRRGALRAIELAAPEWLASKAPLEVDERGRASRYCLSLDPSHGYLCTFPAGHKGEHAAIASHDGTVYSRWSA